MPRLIVDHLPTRFTARDLVELFAPYGTVLSAEVVRTELGQSVRFGYVEMSNDSEARSASTALDGTIVNGQTLHVAPT